MYRITIICNGLSFEDGKEASEDITKEFREHRDWHNNAVCLWDGETLMLTIENEFDSNGLATLDEFSDCLAAYVIDYARCTISIDSVTKIGV